MPKQGTSNEYHNICLSGEIGKNVILSVDKLAISGTMYPLRKHAYSNILKILQPKKGKFSDKKILIFFIFFSQNIPCEYSLEPPRRGGSNEYPQSMFF